MTAKGQQTKSRENQGLSNGQRLHRRQAQKDGEVEWTGRRLWCLENKAPPFYVDLSLRPFSIPLPSLIEQFGVHMVSIQQQKENMPSLFVCRYTATLMLFTL